MKGWRKGVCKWPKDGVKYWRVNFDIGSPLWVCEIECGKSEGGTISSYEDWKYGNFFETKEKAEAAMVEWITDEARRIGIVMEAAR